MREGKYVSLAQLGHELARSRMSVAPQES
jgi:hypothetical protein